jgi:hypothetical protein
MDATGLMAREGRSASAALTAGLSITWQQRQQQQQQASVQVAVTSLASSRCTAASTGVWGADPNATQAQLTKHLCN